MEYVPSPLFTIRSENKGFLDSHFMQTSQVYEDISIECISPECIDQLNILIRSNTFRLKLELSLIGQWNSASEESTVYQGTRSLQDIAKLFFALKAGFIHLYSPFLKIIIFMCAFNMHELKHMKMHNAAIGIPPQVTNCQYLLNTFNVWGIT